MKIIEFSGWHFLAVRRCAQALGLPMPDSPTLSMALGTTCATPLQVAAAYAALAARGVAAEPYLVNRIKDSNGATIFLHRNKTRRVARRCRRSCYQLAV
jgi:membrane carboxypeptidase/penicillin-binding protein